MTSFSNIYMFHNAKRENKRDNKVQNKNLSSHINQVVPKMSSLAKTVITTQTMIKPSST